MIGRAVAQGAEVKTCGYLDTLCGAGEMAWLRLPSGLCLDILEAAA